MGRFDNITATPRSAAPTSLPGAGRFDSIGRNSRFNGGRFASITAQKPGDSPSIISRGFSAIGGAFGTVGKILSTGQTATTGIIERGLEKVGVLKDTGSRGTGALTGIKQNRSNVDVLRRVGEENISPDNPAGIIFGQYNPSTSVLGNFVKELPSTTLGIGADVFLDPLNTLGSAGNVADATYFVGSKLKDAGNKLTETVPATQKIADLLGRAFITRYGQSDAFKEADRARLIAESEVGSKATKLVSDIIEKPAYIQQRIKQVIAGGITNDNEIKILAEPIREELDRVGRAISDINPKLLNPDVFEANKGTYFPRLYTDYEFPADEKVIDNVFGSRAVNVPKDRFKARELTDAQSLAKGTRIEEAAYPAAKGIVQLGVTEARQNFFKEVSKMASDMPKPGWIQLGEDKALGALAGKFLPAAEYKAIAEIRRTPTQLEQIYSKGLQTWKAFKTAYNPATLSRNDITNYLVLNPLGGVGPHRIDIYAKTLNDLMQKGKYYQMARQEGLEISTQESAELIKKASQLYKTDSNIKGFFGKVQDFHRAVLHFYGSQDKFFKLANFIKGVESDGLTPYQAMRRANFYLVDYSEVPELVQWLRKSPVGIPFLSFTYGVSKPLAKTLLERPDKLGAYYKILRDVQNMRLQEGDQQARQTEESVLPKWIHDSTFLRLPVRDKYNRGQYVDLQYILPFNILEEKSIVPSSPVLNTIGALLFNKDPFFEKEIVSSTDSHEEKIQKRVAFVASQLLPSFTPVVGTSYKKILNSIQGRPDKTGIVKDRWQVLLDVFGGVKAQPIDPTIEAQKRAYEKQREIDDLRSELRRIMLDKTLFKDERQKQSDEVRSKLEKATLR